MDWQSLLSALCLVFVIEGLMPFINPDSWKKLMAQMSTVDSKSLRTFGLVSMLSGVLGLWLVRG